MTIDEARENIGGLVRYDGSFDDYEYGLIHSVTKDWVFVRFSLGETAAACHPVQLVLLVHPFERRPE